MHLPPTRVALRAESRDARRRLHDVRQVERADCGDSKEHNACMHATEDLVAHPAAHPARDCEDDAEATAQRQRVVDHCALVVHDPHDGPAVGDEFSRDEHEAEGAIREQIYNVEFFERGLYDESDGQDGNTNCVCLEKECVCFMEPEQTYSAVSKLGHVQNTCQRHNLPGGVVHGCPCRLRAFERMGYGDVEHRHKAQPRVPSKHRDLQQCPRIISHVQAQCDQAKNAAETKNCRQRVYRYNVRHVPGCCNA
mmetsp:Transcript_44660/g.97250  ORF Transcript_44660/g.97250 Transcript_44660/m.97250 type:complete len:252 (-) Transcript_44660:496-1251(-)